MCVYVIHMEREMPSKQHAQHYVGFSPDVPKRMRAHRRGTGARILRAAKRLYGIRFRIVRVFADEGRAFERALKQRKDIRPLCPECRGAYLARKRERSRRYYARQRTTALPAAA